MTTYLVTGATGFLGVRLVERLLRRAACERVFVLVRPASKAKLDQIAQRWPQPERVWPVSGDLTEPGLGLDDADHARLADVDHVIHLGASYDLTADEATARAANVDGTRHVVDLVAELGSAKLHHVSSVAVAGDHRGAFTENDFDLGQRFDSPYHATKFEAERVVRERSGIAWQIYRPSAIVGDSRTGEMDKIDGPYYFFGALAELSRLPAALPLAGADLGSTNMVPVDWVADALDRLVHNDFEPGRTFHLTAPGAQSLTSVYNALAEAAGAPRIAITAPVPVRALLNLPGLGKLLGVPPEVLPHMTFSASFDRSNTDRALADLPTPEFGEYANQLWRYWRRHLDPDRARRPRDGLRGRQIVITGASSGIGRATALQVAQLGAVPLLVARRAEELETVRDEIMREGGQAHVYPCDLTDSESVRATVKRMLSDHEGIDMLVNNAGRSIRRGVLNSVDRLHDYERTMAINYFGAVRLVLALLPHMTARRFGHIVNVSTKGVQIATPRYSAYLASKAALDMFSRVVASETVADGVTFSTVHMGLVKTPMSEATSAYDRIPGATPEEGARLVVRALTRRPKRVGSAAGALAQAAYAITPKAVDRAMHVLYRLMPEAPRRTP
ncbi:SDR family oxidoreductase [Allokutzneria sp. A3M-2-11 16]|uniref:SDR family oxidoreductase n=1 Tax=Allokutzneria sp. A3M-2-11 16 TaxID=2962043 RepID=UPI0020B79DBF|nr:SDR family oxidoreductase [Allokutzneria sp. A3M-2-11 16]MCP3800808.1 SDR family oxidoreductase [Allokutzneria sp. A3M-2-11 16]